MAVAIDVLDKGAVPFVFEGGDIELKYGSAVVIGEIRVLAHIIIYVTLQLSVAFITIKAVFSYSSVTVNQFIDGYKRTFIETDQGHIFFFHRILPVLKIFFGEAFPRHQILAHLITATQHVDIEVNGLFALLV